MTKEQFDRQQWHKGMKVRNSTTGAAFEVGGVDFSGNICVFSMKYYEKKDSLLLSARDNSSRAPVETIEVSLDDFRILQSRGRCNQDSPFHTEIVNLVNDNMCEIKKICQAI